MIADVTLPGLMPRPTTARASEPACGVILNDTAPPSRLAIVNCQLPESPPLGQTNATVASTPPTTATPALSDLDNNNVDDAVIKSPPVCENAAVTVAAAPAESDAMNVTR